jgi:predicted MFS family arabinose efflux permease
VSGAPGRLPALREPAFRSLFFGQALSRLGDRIAPVALAFGVLGIGGSAADLGIVIGAGTVPFALFALAAGVWADRLPRQRLMLASDLIRAVVQALTGALLIAGAAEVWMLAALAAVYGTADAFFSPAMNGLVPQTISAARLQEANALLGGWMSLSNVIGPAIAGVLIAVADPGGAILLDAATFVVSAAFLARLTLGPVEVDEETSFLAALRGGWREVTSRSWLWSVLGAMSIYHVVVLPSVFVLGPVLAERELHGASSWAIIVSAFGVGSVIGQLLIYRLPFRRPIRASVLALIVASSQAAIIGSGLGTWGIAALEAVTGVAVSLFFTLWEISLQQQVPARALSRVSSYDFFASSGLMPIGLVLAGPVSEGLGLHTTLHLMSAVGVGSALACLAIPSVRRLARPVESG